MMIFIHLGLSMLVAVFSKPTTPLTPQAEGPSVIIPHAPS